MGGVCPDVLNPAIDPTLILESLTQEHGVIRPTASNGLRGRLPVGARVRVLPNHSCLAVACFDRLHVIEGEEVVDSWKVQRER
jgi:D-serine deaminase-like pyridoxal phosphate-dependent protein